MTDQQLYELACQAMERAYAPYSGYRVGACLLSRDGQTFQGCNIENASFGATLCAERSAVCHAVSLGVRDFSAIAIVGSASMAWPCGICRQVLREFGADLRVLIGHAGHGFQVTTLKDLLPNSFGPESM